MTRHQIIDLIYDAGLSRVVDDLEVLLKEGIRLEAHSIDMDALELGQSRIGGVPDLPPELSWPEWKGVPQSFIAQICLSDLSQVKEAPFTIQAPMETQPRLFDPGPQTTPPPEVASVAYSVLPRTGTLYFFCMAQNDETWEEDRTAWKALYDNGDSARLVRTSRPAQEQNGEPLFWGGPHAVTFQREWTLPAPDAYEIERLGLSRSEEEIYRGEFLSDLAIAHGFEGVDNRLLGYPLQIQDDVPEYHTKHEGGDWQLLLQVPNGWGGCLYYWMPSDALKELDFSLAWLIMQWD